MNLSTSCNEEQKKLKSFAKKLVIDFIEDNIQVEVFAYIDGIRVNILKSPFSIKSNFDLNNLYFSNTSEKLFCTYQDIIAMSNWYNVKFNNKTFQFERTEKTTANSLKVV